MLDVGVARLADDKKLVGGNNPKWRVALVAAVWVFFGGFVVWAALLPNFVRCRHSQGPLTACKSNLKNMGTAMEMYSTDWSGKYPHNVGYLTPNYLKTMPDCPKAKRPTYKMTFGESAPYNTQSYRDYYFIECTGGNHLEVDVPWNYPQYNGIIGLIER